MDDFVYVLIAALILIGIFLVLPAELMNEKEVVLGESILKMENVGRIGMLSDLPARRINYDEFKLRGTQEEELRFLKNLEVERGYFGGREKEIEIRVNEEILNSLKDVVLTFYVGETNNLGELSVKWNGEEVASKKFGVGMHEVKIESGKVRKENYLSFEAKNPGIMFWTATRYGLKNIRVVAEYGPEKFLFFEVSASDIEAFNKGVLRFNAVEVEEGELLVSVNGYAIFDGKPSYINKLNFTRENAPISVGINTISFKAKRGEFNINNIELDVYTASNNVAIEREFIVEKDVYDSIKNKKLYLNLSVRKIENPGVLSVKINGNALNIQNVKEGSNLFEFPSSYIKEGKNILTVSFTGTLDVESVVVAKG